MELYVIIKIKCPTSRPKKIIWIENLVILALNFLSYTCDTVEEHTKPFTENEKKICRRNTLNFAIESPPRRTSDVQPLQGVEYEII